MRTYVHELVINISVISLFVVIVHDGYTIRLARRYRDQPTPNTAAARLCMYTVHYCLSLSQQTGQNYVVTEGLTFTAFTLCRLY